VALCGRPGPFCLMLRGFSRNTQHAARRTGPVDEAKRAVSSLRPIVAAELTEAACDQFRRTDISVVLAKALETYTRVGMPRHIEMTQTLLDRAAESYSPI
jgi:hypothetical protein